MRLLGSLFTILLFLGIMIEVVVFSPREVGGPEKPKIKPAEIADQSGNDQWIQGVHLIETRENKKEWELQAEKAMSLKDKGSWKLKVVQAKFFNNDDEGSFFTVTGDEGNVTVTTKDMDVMGHVIIRSSNGYQFTTNSVNYASDNKLIRTQDPVHMVSSQDKDGTQLFLDGVGLNAYVDQQYMDVLSDVRVNKNLEDGRVVRIKSSTARFLSKNREAEFRGNVVVDIGASRITGPYAKFEYDTEKKSISAMEVEGGVNLSDVDKWATAKKIRMSFLNDRITLNGSPRVVQNDDEVVGEEITFIEGGKKILVSKGKAKFDSNLKEKK